FAECTCANLNWRQEYPGFAEPTNSGKKTFPNFARTRKPEGGSAQLSHYFIRFHNLCSQASQLGKGTRTILGLQGFDCVSDDRHTTAALEQALGSQANAIFSSHSEYNKLRAAAQTL